MYNKEAITNLILTCSPLQGYSPPTVTISMFIVLFTSGPHLRHNYHGNKTLETMLSGFVESSDID